MVVCSIRPVKLAQASLDTHPKPGDHNGAIMAYPAKVRLCRSTLTWLGNAISRGSETLGARYCLGKHRYRANLLMWESVPMPLLPPPPLTKHALSVDNIGPPLPLTTRVIMTPPLNLGYKYEKLRKKGGC